MQVLVAIGLVILIGVIMLRAGFRPKIGDQGQVKVTRVRKGSSRDDR